MSYLFRFTGNWTNCCSVMPLNAPSAKIFWRTLHGREVQSKSFGFGLLASDSKSNMFFRILKKKVVDMVSEIYEMHSRPLNRLVEMIIFFPGFLSW